MRPRSTWTWSVFGWSALLSTKGVRLAPEKAEILCFGESEWGADVDKDRERDLLRGYDGDVACSFRWSTRWLLRNEYLWCCSVFVERESGVACVVFPRELFVSRSSTILSASEWIGDTLDCGTFACVEARCVALPSLDELTGTETDSTGVMAFDECSWIDCVDTMWEELVCRAACWFLVSGMLVHRDLSFQHCFSVVKFRK